MVVPIRRVRPTEVGDYLPNPHRGCCTFQHFAGDELFEGVGWTEEGPTAFPERKYPGTAPGYLPSTVAYCRWFWSLIEPARGRYDFSVIDQSLAVCADRGQTLAVRLMPHGSARQPQVPEWYAQSCPMYLNQHKKVAFTAPVYEAPQYLEHFGRLIREFAARYDGHPLLESIDIAYIGPWGEGAGECGPEHCRRFAELWAEALPKTPRLALIGGVQMKPAIETGAGWRCDCFGDLRGFGGPFPAHLQWNHMYDCYPQAVARAAAAEAWQHAPVHYETCWVPRVWHEQQRDIDFILRQGLKYHGTYFMPKSTRLPEAWMDRLEAFCRSLGYRFVFRQAVISTQVPADGSLALEAWIENVGVAPIYRRYDLAVRFRQGDREEVVPLEGVDPRTWLPGDAIVETKVPLPAGLKPGWVELSAGLIDRASRQVKVRFAVKEQYADGWVALDGFEVLPG